MYVYIPLEWMTEPKQSRSTIGTTTFLQPSFQHFILAGAPRKILSEADPMADSVPEAVESAKRDRGRTTIATSSVHVCGLGSGVSSLCSYTPRPLVPRQVDHMHSLI